MSVLPSSEVFRTIAIYDKCIPEHKLDVPISTESAASLLIEGPHEAVIGQTLEFTTSLLTSEGKKISPRSYQHITWTWSPTENLTRNPETNKWQMECQSSGRFEFEIMADDVSRTHDINIYEKLAFPEDSITMFVNEFKALRVAGGPENFNMIKLESTNSSIVNIEGNVAYALTSGSIDVIATVPENPNIAPATLHIRVLDAKDLSLVYNGDNLYVGSYVHIRPYIETDGGPIPANRVGWIVDGITTQKCSQIYKIYNFYS